MENKTSWLATFFTKQRELIEAAETPFAKLTVFILPILSPMVPALMTGVHLFQLFVQIFKFGTPETTNLVAFVLSAIPSIVLELLGYVGAITAIKSLFVWVNSQTSGHLVPMVLNGLAYLFYLVAMLTINVFLGKYLGEEGVVTGVIAVLSFITVPTSLIAANHLVEIGIREDEERSRRLKLEDDERDYQRQAQQRTEKEEYRLRGKMVKNGMNPLQTYAVDTVSVSTPETSRRRDVDWRTLTYEQKMEVVHVLSIPQIMEKYGKAESTAYLWKSKKL